MMLEFFQDHLLEFQRIVFKRGFAARQHGPPQLQLMKIHEVVWKPITVPAK